MYRPIHFEIPASNPERMMEFYSKVLRWKFTKWEGPTDYWLISTGDTKEPGIDGGILRRRDPAQPCVNTVNVPNLDETLTTIQASGGRCVVPKMAIPGVGWLAYCMDPEGNMLGYMQPDTGAA